MSMRTTPEPTGRVGGDPPVLELRDLQVHIPVRHGLRREVVRAVDGVSLAVRRGETLGLVGESGCGKSTTARAAVRLQPATGGSVWLDGTDITRLRGDRLRRLRRQVQIVFQDPFSALNPRMTVGQIVAEPMRAQGATRARTAARVPELLDLVGLQARHRHAYPHQFSGGQRQRIGTARALATDPDVLILDEPVSALDVSVQAQVVNLFSDLQQRLGLAIVFISHDLSVVRHISDTVAVMYLGRIVEQGPALQVLERPQHPYTEALVSAAPGRPAAAGERIVLRGDVPSPLDPPSGCRFRTRCWKATEQCLTEPLLETPPQAPLGTQRGRSASVAHPVACWHPAG